MGGKKPTNRDLDGAKNLGHKPRSGAFLVELKCPTTGDCSKCTVKQSGILLGNQTANPNAERNRGKDDPPTYNEGIVKEIQKLKPNFKPGVSFEDTPEARALCVDGQLVFIDAPNLGQVNWGTIEFTTEFVSASSDCPYKKCVVVWRYAFRGGVIDGQIGDTNVSVRKIYCVKKDGTVDPSFDVEKDEKK